ncbi:hypothetical protein [Nisaea nitritireducens]|uniref:hypothetical protein n=1 Tax=Nisaea nitritireducens TaxID=568392 RepID=UPI00186727AC|nr:hypothetical protein [Nisaea nitritireducens]
MNIRKYLASAIAAALVMAVYPQISQAETFTSREFLTWKSESRVAFIGNSVSMVAVVATQFDKEQARCINAWHAGQHNEGYPELLRLLRQYADYHPQGVILSLLQKRCGKLNPDD